VGNTALARAQVPHVTSRALHRLVPGARLTIVPQGGHFAYYVCNQTAQLAALGQLLRPRPPPKPPCQGLLYTCRPVGPALSPAAAGIRPVAGQLQAFGLLLASCASFISDICTS